MTLTQLTPEQLRHFQASYQSLADHPVLLNAQFLSALAESGRDQLDQLVSEHHCAAGEVLFHEGAPGDAMYVVRSGRVAIFKGLPEAPTVLGFRGAGETIGEMALIEDQQRSASAVALEAALCLRIGRENFQRWLTLNPSAGINLLRTVSARLRESDNARNHDNALGRELLGQITELRTEREQLLELQRLRQEMADLIVHDLRNPLNSIMGALDLLKVCLPDGALEQNEAILSIARLSADRINRLVNIMLEVSRMESGATQLVLTDVPVAKLVEDVAERFAVLARQAEVKITVAVPPNPPIVRADRELLERVLTNLSDNALKYTPPQGTMTLGLVCHAKDVELSVTDSGPGIPADQRERIFERFAQVAGESARRRGFGLGLVFCRLTVEAHGGRIWVEPGLNEHGSRFAFTLPLPTAQ